MLSLLWMIYSCALTLTDVVGWDSVCVYQLHMIPKFLRFILFSGACYELIRSHSVEFAWRKISHIHCARQQLTSVYTYLVSRQMLKVQHTTRKCKTNQTTNQKSLKPINKPIKEKYLGILHFICDVCVPVKCGETRIVFGVEPKLLIRTDYCCVFGCRWAPAWLPAIVWQAYFYRQYHVKAKRCIIHQQLQESPMISTITEFQVELGDMKWNQMLHVEYHTTDYY